MGTLQERTSGLPAVISEVIPRSLSVLLPVKVGNHSENAHNKF
jgi:hypothetical protein